MIVGWMFGRIVPLLLLFVVHYGSSFVYNVRSVQSYHGLKNYEDQFVLVRNSSDSQVEVNEETNVDEEERQAGHEYKWVCNGVVERESMPLNEAVMQISGVSVDRANELIALGALNFVFNI